MISLFANSRLGYGWAPQNQSQIFKSLFSESVGSREKMTRNYFARAFAILCLCLYIIIKLMNCTLGGIELSIFSFTRSVRQIVLVIFSQWCKFSGHIAYIIDSGASVSVWLCVDRLVLSRIFWSRSGAPLRVGFSESLFVSTREKYSEFSGMWINNFLEQRIF